MPVTFPVANYPATLPLEIPGGAFRTKYLGQETRLRVDFKKQFVLFPDLTTYEIAIISQLELSMPMLMNYATCSWPTRARKTSSSTPKAGCSLWISETYSPNEWPNSPTYKTPVPWVFPRFSPPPSTANDTICSVLIMSTLKEYFNYRRVVHIPEFGAEPREWAGMFRVILTRFVRAFDAGGPQGDKEFRERILHHQGGSGDNFISGWLSAFCAWTTRVFSLHLGTTRDFQLTQSVRDRDP
ncbi:hypothetical protein LshimejAT787_0800800 [Lyophyllum shimeji]|uniref:Uncharacterized protein n=1 Tax=Lyophyllum shimeji TaxID=47721 RepID=A0A9P3UMA1_LYOSH|nr:hypothetical protein LshimejAT787_0800800 [Lyophyllum shimeji]